MTTRDILLAYGLPGAVALTILILSAFTIDRIERRESMDIEVGDLIVSLIDFPNNDHAYSSSLIVVPKRTSGIVRDILHDGLLWVEWLDLDNEVMRDSDNMYPVYANVRSIARVRRG